MNKKANKALLLNKFLAIFQILRRARRELAKEMPKGL